MCLLKDCNIKRTINVDTVWKWLLKIVYTPDVELKIILKTWCMSDIQINP